MKLHEIRHIDRPLPEVFAYVADFSNSAGWDPGVASSEAATADEPHVGSTYELIVSFGSRKVPMTYEITELVKDSRVVLEGRGANVLAVDDIRFQEKDGGTIVDYTADLRLTGVMRFVAPFLAPLLRRVGERALDGMVEALER